MTPNFRSVAAILCYTEYGLSDENSELEPPDPISNSEVKRLSADGSVGSPHVRVGHRQAFILNAPTLA
jgi:hypothetical protein